MKRSKLIIGMIMCCLTFSYPGEEAESIWYESILGYSCMDRSTCLCRCMMI